MDDLIRAFEPFWSYRVVVGLLFGGMFLYSVIETVLRYRDLRRDLHGRAGPYRLDVVFAKYVKYALLRAFSLRTLRRHGGQIAQVLALAAALAALQVWFWFG